MLSGYLVADTHLPRETVPERFHPRHHNAGESRYNCSRKFIAYLVLSELQNPTKVHLCICALGHRRLFISFRYDPASWQNCLSTTKNKKASRVCTCKKYVDREARDICSPFNSEANDIPVLTFRPSSQPEDSASCMSPDHGLEPSVKPYGLIASTPCQRERERMNRIYTAFLLPVPNAGCTKRELMIITAVKSRCV